MVLQRREAVPDERETIVPGLMGSFTIDQNVSHHADRHVNTSVPRDCAKHADDKAQAAQW